MWIEWVIKILKNRLLLSIAVDMCIAYLLIFIKYIFCIGVKNFLITQFDVEIFLLPLKMPIFYFAIFIVAASIWIAKFIFNILCLFSRTFILAKLEAIRTIIFQKNTQHDLNLKRFSIIYTVKTLKNIIYTCSVFIFTFIYTFILSFAFNNTLYFRIIEIISLIFLIISYFITFIIIIRNYFTAIAVKDILSATRTDGYQSLRDIFRWTPVWTLTRIMQWWHRYKRKTPDHLPIIEVLI